MSSQPSHSQPNTHLKSLHSYSESQSSAIQQIRIIAKSMFGQQLNISSQNSHQSYLSYLQNPKENQSENCNQKKKNYIIQKQEWISLYDFDQQKNYQSFELEKNKNNQGEKKQKVDKNQKSQKETDIRERSEKNYMKPTKHFKKNFKIDFNPQEPQIIPTKLKQSKQSLTNFYKNNTPLYQKFISSKIKKQQQEQKHKVQKIAKQMQQVTFHPQINQYDQIKQPFSKRQQIYKKNRQQKQSKIINQVMINCSFRPKVNNKNIESVVKQRWLKSPVSKGNSQIEVDPLKGISESIIKTGSFFSQLSKKQQEQQYKSINLFTVKIQNPLNQLNFLVKNKQKE